MLEYSRTVLNQTLDDVKKIGLVSNFTTQGIYIAYLIYAIAFGAGLLYVNIPLLVISLAHLVFSIVMERKKQKKTDGKLKSQAKKAYKIAKYIILLPTLIASIITLATLESDQITFSLLFTIMMILGYVTSIIISVLIKILDHRFNMFMVAIKADMEPVINAYNTFKKFKGERVAEPSPDKTEQKIRADLDSKVQKMREENPPAEKTVEMMDKEELKAVRKEIITSIASNVAEKTRQKFKSFATNLKTFTSHPDSDSADMSDAPQLPDASAPEKVEPQRSTDIIDDREMVEK